MAKGFAYTVAFALVGIVGPNVVMKDKNSPHAFTRINSAITPRS